MKRRKRQRNQAISLMPSITTTIIVVLVLVFLTLIHNQDISLTNAEHTSSLAKSIQVRYHKLFFNETLHWQQVNRDFTLQSIDPANGKEVLADIWAKTDSQGNLVNYHSVYTLKDGTFLQELFLNQAKIVFIRGKIYQHLMPKPLFKNWCLIQDQQDVQKLQERLPPFIDESLLSQQDFVKSKNVTNDAKILDSALTIPNVIPVATYSVHQNLHTWFRKQSLSNTNLVEETMDITFEGRMIWDHTITKNPSGTIQQENWVSVGTLLVYNSSDVFTSLQWGTAQQEGDCNR